MQTLQPLIATLFVLLALTLSACGDTRFRGREGLEARAVDLPQPTPVEVLRVHDLTFQAGAPALAPDEIARLFSFLNNVGATSGDRYVVVIEPDGGADLARQRQNAVIALFNRRGLSAVPDTVAGQLSDTGNAGLIIMRRLELADAAACQETGDPARRLGCSTSHLLGQMVVNPADLTAGRGSTYSDGARAALLYERYRSDSNAYSQAITAPSTTN